MGRGKCWSREESEAVAKAWKIASAHTVTLREQSTKRFAADLYQSFVEFAPKNDETALDGRWTSRSQTAVKTQFDAIGDDILKFNVVMAGLIEQAASRNIPFHDTRVLRASIGVHLGSIPNALAVDFDNIDTAETDWKLFEAWQVLKTCPRFASVNVPWPTLHPGAIVSHGLAHPSTSTMNINAVMPGTLPLPSSSLQTPPRVIMHSETQRTNAAPTTTPSNETHRMATPTQYTPTHPSQNGHADVMSTTDGASREMPTGNTPMRTLASAALSMPAAASLLPTAEHPHNDLSATPSPRRTPPSGTTMLKTMPSAVAAVSNGTTPNGISENPTLHPARPLKRRLPTGDDTDSSSDHRPNRSMKNCANGNANGEAQARDFSRPPHANTQRVSACELIASASAIESVGQALRSLGDALSEYNAITLFSRPDMQGRRDQKVFFETLAAKHVLKAKLDLDELERQMQRATESGRHPDNN